MYPKEFSDILTNTCLVPLEIKMVLKTKIYWYKWDERQDSSVNLTSEHWWVRGWYFNGLVEGFWFCVGCFFLFL